MNIAINLNSVRAEARGIPRLVFNFLAKNISDLNLAIFGAYAEIRVTPSFGGHDLSNSYFIGYAVMEYSSPQFPKHTEQNWDFALPLHPPALQKIEEMRKGGDLYGTALFYCPAAVVQDGASPLSALGRATVSTQGYSTNYCPFKVAQSDWEKILNDLGAAQILDAEAIIRLASEQAQETLKEIRTVAEKAKEAASITGVAQHARYFEDEAKAHRRLSYVWLFATAFLGLAAGVYSWVSFHFGVLPSAEGPGTWWAHVTYLSSRLIVLSVIFLGMGWSAKNYRAHKHNEIVNRHRQNALRTFETFAVAASDAATKDAVLLATTKSIFESQNSGYLSGEVEKIPSGPPVEIFKKVIQPHE